MNQRMAREFEAVAKQNKALAEQFKAVAEQNKSLATKVDALTRQAERPRSIGSAPGTMGGAGDSSGEMRRSGDDDDDREDDDDDDDKEDEDERRRDRRLDELERKYFEAQATPGFGRDFSEIDDDDHPQDIYTDEPRPTRVGASEAGAAGAGERTKTRFGKGYSLETEDGEYQLQFHNETQLDVRTFEQRGSNPVNQTGFYIPRMRLYFNGRLTKPIQYSVSINKGLGSLDLLDAYLNFNYDKRFQIRIGRYRVPFTYDWYALSNTFLTTPERSIFALNYGYNRNFGVMAHGGLFEDRVDYAVAGVNGPRNSYFDRNGHKDVLAYVNYRPFYHSERLPFLKNLNVGGSAAYGIQDQAALPSAFRTTASATQSAGTIEAGPSFLQLNNGVVERGRREMWELHAAYYYKGLSLIGAYDRGFNSYALDDARPTVHLPTHGFHVASAYFLTGEHVERRTFVEPLHPFDLRKGKFGLGAWEIQARYSEFAVGDEVFTGGLADPNLWTNHVYAVDSGLNWYLNKYVKVYLDWQHAVYGSPVPYRPGGLQKTSDLFWLRFQIYY